MKLLKTFSFFLLVYLTVIPAFAYGYLDPATGSMVLQVAVGGLLAALAAIRIYWKKIRSLFARSAVKPGTEK